jgi:phosphoadenosine phosphosulfate reductase family protein
VRTFIAFSGGVESTTLCLLFGGQANAIFADTGDEHAEMYERLGQVEGVLRTIYPKFRIIKVSAGEALHDYIRRKHVAPSPTMRFCTRLFKIAPINAYLQQETPCKLMIGLNADEVDRTGALPIEGVSFEYPLQDLNLTRKKCVDLLKEYNLEPRLPVYMRRGGCTFCFYKSRKEYAAIVHLDPKLANELADFEDEINTGDFRKKRWALVKEIPEGFRAFFENERCSSLFSPEEMYAQQPNVAETPCGVFCHR